MTRNAYKYFFEGLAKKNKAIAHLADGISKRFTVFDAGELLNLGPLELDWSGWVLLVEHYQLNLRGNASGSDKAQYSAGFWVIRIPENKSDPYPEQSAAELIARQFWAKLIHWQREGQGWHVIGGETIRFDDGNFQTSAIRGIHEGAAGVLAEFQFNQYANVAAEYDPAQWTT